MNISLLVLTLCSSILSTTNNINPSSTINNTTNLISNVPSITTQYLSSQSTTTDTLLVDNNINNNIFTSSTEPNQSNKEEIKLEDNKEQSKEITNNKLKESNQQSNNIDFINPELENQSKDALTSSSFIKSSTIDIQLKDDINELDQQEELPQLEEGDNEDIDLVNKNEHQHHFIPIPSFIKRSINIIRKVFQFDSNNNNQLNFNTSTDDNEITSENNKQDLTLLSKNQQDQPDNKIRGIRSDIPIPEATKEQLNKGLSKGAIGGIIGGVVGLLILLSLVGGILFYFLRHKKPTTVFGNNQANEEGGLLTQASNDIEEVILSPINPINKFWPNIEFNPKNQRFSNMSMIESNNNNNNNNNTHSTKVSKFATINKPNTSSPIPINLSNSAGQLKHTPSFKLPNKTSNETIYERRMKKKSQDNSINTTTTTSSLLSSMVDDISSVTEYETDYDEINMDVHIQQMKSDDNSDKDSIELCSVIRSSIINPKLDQLNEVHLRSPSIPPPDYGMNYSKGNNIDQSLFTVEKKDTLKEESIGLLSTNENHSKHRNDRSVSPINRSISPINMGKEEKKKYIFPSEYRVSNVETSDSTNSSLAKVTKLTISSKLKDYNESNPKLSTIPPTTANSIKKSTNRNSTVNQKFGFSNEKYQLDGPDYTNIEDNSFNGISAEKEIDKEIDRRSLDVNRHSLRQTKLFSENRSLLTSGRLQHHRQVSENVKLNKDKETGASKIIKERRKKDLVKHLAGQPPSTPITPKQQALDTDFWGL
ncbi:hypothetical protein K502DRAFT_324359 [Neoconidiobolus thromboides FSU 785]|nr:hypothetical protein K502DRAFT_324359 [Neoconidiobolus thromboides FSU 785]